MKAKTVFPAVLVWILTCAIAVGAQAQQRKTNIVFILTDDQGVWAAGCYGNPEIRTPNIDRLAATGMRFENFFTTIPVCSASRASFLRGRIPSQHGSCRYTPRASQQVEEILRKLRMTELGI